MSRRSVFTREASDAGDNEERMSGRERMVSDARTVWHGYCVFAYTGAESLTFN